VNFDVSITLPWVVEKWNGLESSHHDSLLSTWGFHKFLKRKHSFTPQMILSDRSMCIIPHQGIDFAFFILPLIGLYVELRVRIK
jgi:hypothetical protein